MTRDSVTDYLRAYDEHGRPFGSVFNLHPDYSKIYIGGFPSSAKIQDEVRETSMNGQVYCDLAQHWNYRVTHLLGKNLPLT